LDGHVWGSDSFVRLHTCFTCHPKKGDTHLGTGSLANDTESKGDIQIGHGQFPIQVFQLDLIPLIGQDNDSKRALFGPLAEITVEPEMRLVKFTVFIVRTLPGTFRELASRQTSTRLAKSPNLRRQQLAAHLPMPFARLLKKTMT
jgi:hypothetical protein